MESESCNLSESVLFEARKATSASSSPSYYSSRIHNLMKLKSESGMSDKDAEIEASKTHWTEVESTRYYTPPTSARHESSTEEEWAELHKENVEEMRRLQMEYEKSDFFQVGGQISGEMIAKGGQADIYLEWFDTGDKVIPFVWKIFQAGYRVLELRKQWPIDLLQRFGSEDYEINVDGPRNLILWGRLLDDGRFAFGMLRFWGDVRKLLDVRMQHNGNKYPPFMMEDGSYQELCILRLWHIIAVGMKGLHGDGTLHRDLKASNVLIDKLFRSIKEEDGLNPLEIDDEFMCFVADYECSIGVVGTGLWRAPEILEAVKNRTLDTTPNVFTQKADVYSYAMTCYEILTGFIPFEHPEDVVTSNDDVLEGKRPTLPQHLKPWVMNFFHQCWHQEPLMRPTFVEIEEILGHKAATLCNPAKLMKIVKDLEYSIVTSYLKLLFGKTGFISRS